MSWIAENLVPALRDIPSTSIVDVAIYITGSQDDVGVSWKQPERCPQPNQLPPHQEISAEIPEPQTKRILEAEIKNAGGDISVNRQLLRFRLRSIFLDLKRCFVAVCGGPAMNRTVKAAFSPVRSLDILKGAPSVSLHVETFGDAVRSAFPLK